MCISQTDPASRPPPTQKGRNQWVAHLHTIERWTMWVGLAGQVPATIRATSSGDTHHSWLMIACTQFDCAEFTKLSLRSIGPSYPPEHLSNDQSVDWLTLKLRRVHKPGQLWVPCFIQTQHSQHFPNDCLLTPVMSHKDRKCNSIDWDGAASEWHGIVNTKVMRSGRRHTRLLGENMYQQDNHYRQWQRVPLQSLCWLAVAPGLRHREADITCLSKQTSFWWLATESQQLCMMSNQVQRQMANLSLLGTSRFIEEIITLVNRHVSQ